MTDSNPKPDILLINLDRSSDRLAFQEEQFRQIGIQFERLAAVDGAGIAEDVFRKHAFLWERPLTRPEVGCLLSHHACWQHVMKTGKNTLIVEDDVVLAPEVTVFLESAGAVKGSIALNLEARRSRKYLSVEPVALEGLGAYSIFEMLLGTGGAGAYLLTPQAATRLAADIGRRGQIADGYIWQAPGVRQLQIDPGFALPMDKIPGRFGKHLPRLGKSTIPRQLGVVQLFSHPSLRVRRAFGQLRLAVARFRLIGRSVRRRVTPLPSIYTSYLSIIKGKGAQTP